MTGNIESGGVWIVYDGECPFCTNYVKYMKLKATLGEVRLVNARDGGEVVERVVAAGYDLDEGMALVDGGNIYHGADCMNRLALMSTQSDLVNRINASIFRSRTLSRVLYPALRAGRNATLFLMGRKPIAAE